MRTTLLTSALMCAALIAGGLMLAQAPPAANSATPDEFTIREQFNFVLAPVTAMLRRPEQAASRSP